MLNFSDLPTIISGEILSQNQNSPISDLLIDSRKPVISEGSLFFAIKGERHDGHEFIQQLYEKGIRQFVVEQDISLVHLRGANIIKVSNAVLALQKIAAARRKKIKGKIIGITGSNGKTITKEWLYQLVSPIYYTQRSPRSYNSQVGVPLSIWSLKKEHEIGIIEAGISRESEMMKLQQVIQPEIGIFTNLGTAHDEGFESSFQKASEKAILFQNAQTIIYCRDYPEVAQAIHDLPGVAEKTLLGWSFEDNNALYYVETQETTLGTQISIPHDNGLHRFEVPFTDYASIENITHCIFYLLFERIPDKIIQNNLNQIKPVSMRLEVKQGIHNSYLVDDSYNNDLVGLDTALDFFNQQTQKPNKVIILSDVLESGQSEEALYHQIAHIINQFKPDFFYGVGKAFIQHEALFEIPSKMVLDTSVLLATLEENPIHESVILIKGARTFQFEKVVDRLQQKIHGTVLEINLDALVHNLNFFRAKLRPSVKIMAMVKAFAYGSGIHEVASLLQYNRVDYLAVAYTDEGVTLRQHGITIPIMVMNPTADAFEKLYQHNLEPELYSLPILQQFSSFARQKNKRLKIHLKLDTGMHRLGFEAHELDDALSVILQNKQLEVASVFSHLAGSDSTDHNGFSAKQAFAFKHMSESISKALNYHPIRHLLNSPGISHFPDFQFDMVRLGIGLYGVDATEKQQSFLRNISTLKTVVSQVKSIKAGDTVGYSRKGVAESNMKIATIAIGYADGFDRSFSNGNGYVLIKGQQAQVFGNVCMDMTMVDVTNIPVEAGDEVIVFGNELSIIEMAKRINTIPYEILTNVSERVKRIFYSE